MSSKVVKAEEQKLQDASQYGKQLMMNMHKDMEDYCQKHELETPHLIAGLNLSTAGSISRSVTLQDVSGNEMITFCAGLLRELVENGADRTILMMDVNQRIDNISNDR